MRNLHSPIYGFPKSIRSSLYRMNGLHIYREEVVRAATSEKKAKTLYT